MATIFKIHGLSFYAPLPRVVEMNHLKILIMCCFLLAPALLLPGCASNQGDELAEAHLVPGPPPVIDPSDMVLKQSVLEIMKETGGPLNSNYTFQRTDLNNDGRRDAIVLFRTPYGFWCGTHGCTMFVMQAHNESFSLVSAIQTVRPPVHVSEVETNGWKNLILRVSGRSIKAKDVAMKFDGTGYPQYPDIVEPVAPLEYAMRTEIIN